MQRPSPPGAPGNERQIVFQVGPLRLTGAAALVATLVLFGGIISAVYYFRARIRSTPLSISAALWIAFMIYWSIAAGRTVPTKSRESRASRRLHEWMIYIALFLVFVPVPGLDRRILPAGTWVVVTGLALHVASFGLALSARRHLGRFWSGEITKKVGHELVRTGPYRFVRHPIYTAILGMFVGMAIVSGDAHAFVAVALVAFAYGRKIRLEEQNLRELFGPTYDEYCRTTSALVPWVL